MISSQPPVPSAPTSLKPLLAGGLMFALIGLLFDTQGIKAFLSQPIASQSPSTQATCSRVIQDNAQLTREQLGQLLIIPEREPKSRVRQVVSEPYCAYPSLKVRSGVEAEREAYPLAFDPTTTLIILYENDEYAGYRFSFE